MSPKLSNAEQGTAPKRGKQLSKERQSLTRRLLPRAALCQIYDSIFRTLALLSQQNSSPADMATSRGFAYGSSQVQCQHRVCLSTEFQNPPEYVATKSLDAQSARLTPFFSL